MNLPYTIEVIREADPDHPGRVARVVELPGCTTQGVSFNQFINVALAGAVGFGPPQITPGASIPYDDTRE